MQEPRPKGLLRIGLIPGAEAPGFHRFAFGGEKRVWGIRPHPTQANGWLLHPSDEDPSPGPPA